MGLFKKAYGCKSCGGRVRQKPLRATQLYLFGDLTEEVFYVRSSKERSSNGSQSFKEDVFGHSPMDSSDECSQRTNERRISSLK